MRFIFTLLFLVGTGLVCHSQDVTHLFPDRDWIMYVGVGDLDGKRVVSDIRVTPKDSANREIQVKLEILTDWKISDSLELDLVLDPVTNTRINTGQEEVEAIRYRLKDSEVFIDFEKPQSFNYYNQNQELITSWISRYAFVSFPQQLKKYQQVLKIYHEK